MEASTVSAEERERQRNVQVVRKLYAGTIQFEIPARFEDVSLFRQVPNHQEVFADADTGQSIIIEIVQLEEEVPDEQSAQFHFEELSRANQASRNDIISVTRLTGANVPLCAIGADPMSLGTPIFGSVCTGTQHVAKFNEVDKYGEGARKQVLVVVACFRLKSVTSDVLIVFSAPVDTLEGGEAVGQLGSQLPKHVWDRCLRSLKVVNWGLFTGDGFVSEEDDEKEGEEGSMMREEGEGSENTANNARRNGEGQQGR